MVRQQDVAAPAPSHASLLSRIRSSSQQLRSTPAGSAPPTSLLYSSSYSSPYQLPRPLPDPGAALRGGLGTDSASMASEFVQMPLSGIGPPTRRAPPPPSLPLLPLGGPADAPTGAANVHHPGGNPLHRLSSAALLPKPQFPSRPPPQLPQQSPAATTIPPPPSLQVLDSPVLQTAGPPSPQPRDRVTSPSALSSVSQAPYHAPAAPPSASISFVSPTPGRNLAGDLPEPASEEPPAVALPTYIGESSVAAAPLQQPGGFRGGDSKRHPPVVVGGSSTPPPIARGQPSAETHSGGVVSVTPLPRVLGARAQPQQPLPQQPYPPSDIRSGSYAFTGARSLAGVGFAPASAAAPSVASADATSFGADCLS